MSRKFSIVVVPHSGGRTREWRFSVVGFRILISSAAAVLLAMIVVFLLALRVHIAKAEYDNQKARIATLESQLGRMNELRAELERMKQEDDKIRAMLGIEQAPPPLDLEQLYAALAADSSFLLDSEAMRRLESIPRDIPTRLNPAMPGIPPLAAYTVSRNIGPRHTGIDLVAETGTPVMATADGFIAFAGWDTIYGNAVRVRHPGSFETFYGHLYRIMRIPGDSVRQGDIIGLVGSTGRSTAPHLHYEVIKAGKAQDPQKYFQ